MTSLTSTNVFTISCLSIEPSPLPPPPLRSGKFSSTALVQSLAKSLLHYSSTIRTIRRLFANYSYYSRTIRTIRRLFADYSYYSSTIRGLFVLFVDYSRYSHYSLHYSSFINCPSDGPYTRSHLFTIRTSYPPRSPHHGWGRSMYCRFHALSPFALMSALDLGILFLFNFFNIQRFFTRKDWD
jgi:hypothetical protein